MVNPKKDKKESHTVLVRLRADRDGKITKAEVKPGVQLVKLEQDTGKRKSVRIQLDTFGLNIKDGYRRITPTPIVYKERTPRISKFANLTEDEKRERRNRMARERRLVKKLTTEGIKI